MPVKPATRTLAPIGIGLRGTGLGGGARRMTPSGSNWVHERFDLRLWAARRSVAELDQAEHADGAVDGAPGVADADEQIAGEQRPGRRLGGKDLEADALEALGGETFPPDEGARDRPISHGRRKTLLNGRAVKPLQFDSRRAPGPIG